MAFKGNPKRAGLGGWRIASLRGVAIRIHFSLIFLLLYVIFIASEQFPFVVEQSGISASEIAGSPLLWGTVFALALFLSVLLHELSHVWMARSMGVRVEGITLMMLGGVSEMEKIPEKPFSEFKISIVGPLTSLALAGLLTLGSARSGSPEASFFCYWLARANLVLAIFNLLPAFPLDGGRAFRSLLATRRGMARATETTVKVAHGLAWILGVLGFLQFNLLLILIAFFIYSAATREWAMMVSRGLLKGISVGDAWKRVEAISSGAELQEAVGQMVRERIKALPVDAGPSTPVFLSADVVRLIPRSRWSSLRVGDAMTRVSRFAFLDERLDELLPELAAHGALPVLDEGRIRGILVYSDVAEVLEFRALSEGDVPTGGRAA